jgi:hypothetical protein
VDPLALLPLVSVAGMFAGTYWLGRRSALRHRLLRTASERLSDAGWTVEPAGESDLPSAGSRAEFLRLRASRGRTFASIGFANAREANGTITLDGARVVERASFVIAREKDAITIKRRLGGRDIEIGDASFDELVNVRGWPADQVRGIAAAPMVRAAVTELFSDAAVTAVRSSGGGHDHRGVLFVDWRCSWDDLGRLSAWAERERAEQLGRALDEARYSAPMRQPEKTTARPEGPSAGPASGSPIGVVGLRELAKPSERK